MTRHAFDPLERDAVYRAIRERRDMRHFAAGEVPQEQLQRLLQAAHQAPSVGLMQPWRFVRIPRQALRESIHQLVEQERLETAALDSTQDDTPSATWTAAELRAMRLALSRAVR